MRRCRVPALAPVVFWAALVGMTGCAKGPATRFYTLTPTLATARTTAKAGSLCVGLGPVTLPGLLDHPEIVTRTNESEVERAEFDQWAEPLDDAIPRILVENLAALLEADRIEIRSWTDAVHCQSRVVLDLTRFDGGLGQGVVLDGRWRLLGKDGRDLVVKRVVLTEATHGSSYRDLVTTMSGSLGALSQEIAKALTGIVPPSQAGATLP